MRVSRHENDVPDPRADSDPPNAVQCSNGAQNIQRMMRTSPDRTVSAMAVVAEELECGTAERDAFRRFRSRLATVEPSPTLTAPPTAATRNGGGSAASTLVATGEEPTDDALRRVRSTYRETVMAVPHFEAEYDDTLRENMAVEFGADIAESIVGSRQLSPMHLEALATATDKAIGERSEYLRVLRREQRSLENIREALEGHHEEMTTVERAIDEASASGRLSALDNRLVALGREYADLAESRQRLLHGRSTAVISGIDETSLTAFLYGDREETCPALADVADCLATVRCQRQRCLR